MPAAHPGDVAKAQERARAARDDQVAYVVQAVYGAGDHEAGILVSDMHGACVRLGVAAFQRLEYLLLRDAEPGQPGAVEFDIDGLFLDAPEFDAGDAADQQELLFDEVRLGFQFVDAVSLAGKRKEYAVDVAEVIADAHARDAGGQAGAYVRCFPAQFVPDLGQLRGIDLGAYVHVDERKTAAADRGQVVDLGHFLDLFLYLLGHFPLDLAGDRPGVQCRHRGPFYLEGRAFQLAHAPVGGDAPQEHGQHEHPEERLVLQGIFNDLHSWSPGSAAGRRASSPACPCREGLPVLRITAGALYRLKGGFGKPWRNAVPEALKTVVEQAVPAPEGKGREAWERSPGVRQADRG